MFRKSQNCGIFLTCCYSTFQQFTIKLSSKLCRRFKIVQLVHIFYNSKLSEFLKICTDLQEFCSIWAQNCFVIVSASSLPKIVQKKTILRSNAAYFMQICANLQKYWNNAMTNDGLSIEIIDRSHGEKTQDTSISDKTALKAWIADDIMFEKWKNFMSIKFKKENREKIMHFCSPTKCQPARKARM